MLCKALKEYDILQAALGDCGYLVVPTGWFFSDMYLRLDEENIENEDYTKSLKKYHNLTDLELKHLIHLYKTLEQKRIDF